MNYIIAAIVGYLFGCFQTAYIMGKVFLRKDIRDLGNGNAGASNATVVFGRRFGILTGIVDILKGTMAILLIRLLYESSLDPVSVTGIVYICGFFAVLGHNFPFYMNFRGGKGTATAVGVLFGFDWRLGLGAVLVMLVVVLITDYIAIGTMAMILVFVLYTAIWQPSINNLAVAFILALMSIYKHRQNFINISRGQEKKVRSAFFGAKK